MNFVQIKCNNLLKNKIIHKMGHKHLRAIYFNNQILLSRQEEELEK